mgnify:FL=1|tara:strand:+ start:5038 stop:9162 length:4125 start_codon:yes stop_codon:yes gene_type:complete
MDKVQRRLICLQTHAVNIYNPHELLVQVKPDKLPTGDFNQIYIVEEILAGSKCKTLRSYSLLFLTDVVKLLPVTIDNILSVREKFPLLSLDNILEAWSHETHPHDDWGSLSTSGRNSLVSKRQTKDYYSKKEKPLKKIPATTWVKAKKKLYTLKPQEPDNMKINNLEVTITLKSKSGGKLENLEVFNTIDSSMYLPYVWCDKYVKVNRNSYIPKSWRQNNGVFGCIIKVGDIPVIKPNREITLPSANLLLRVYPDEWVNKPLEDIKYFLAKNNVPIKYLKLFSKEVDLWKDYMASFTAATITVFEDSITITANINPTSAITNKLGSDIGKMIFGTMITDKRYLISKIRPGTLGVSFRYPRIAINSNILFDVISSSSVMCGLLLPQEAKKLGIIEKISKDKYKGGFRILAKIHDKVLKASITQNDGNKRSNGKPYLEVVIKSASNIQAVDDFARLFGTALTLYSNELPKFKALYKSVIPKWKDPPSIINYKGKVCDTNKDCKKDTCNPITKTCSKNISTLGWWAENYSRKCQGAVIRPWVVEPSSVDSLRGLGYNVEEFPKNSGEYLTCRKTAVKGKEVYQNFYIMANTLSNSKDYPFIPCCGSEDRKSHAGNSYNKYYYNLDKLDLNNGANIKITFKKFKKKQLKILLEFAKDKFSVIGFNKHTKKFLDAKKLSVSKEEERLINNYPEDPIGALLISQKGKSTTATIFVEIDIVEIESRSYSNNYEDFESVSIGIQSLLENLFDSAVNKKPNAYSIEFHSDSLKRSEDLHTQKRATIGRRGSLPVNIKRLLDLVSLENDKVSVWKRKGVTRDSSASFLHVVKCFVDNTDISGDSSFAIRAEFLTAVKMLNSGITLCKQSMYDFTTDEILTKLQPNSNAYINPRLFHALVEKIYEVNIILIQRGIDDDEGTFILPHHKNIYLTQGMIYEKTMMVYEHFGTDAEKFLRTPHCELVEGVSNAAIESYMYRIWLYSTKFFYGNTLVTPITIPQVFLASGWKQGINESGKGFLLIKDRFVINTHSLPPVSIEEASAEEVANVKNTEEVVKFAESLHATRIRVHDSIQFVKTTWELNGFNFDTIVWRDNINSLRNKYIINKLNSKYLIGYFLFAFSKYLSDNNITLTKIIEKLDTNSTGKESTLNQSYFLEKKFKILIDGFVKNIVSTVIMKDTIPQSLMTASLPPPLKIYNKKAPVEKSHRKRRRNKKKKAKFYISHPVFTSSKKETETLLFRLKLHATLMMKHDFDKLIAYHTNNSIPDFFNSILDFRKVVNEKIQYRSSDIVRGSTINIYDKPIVNTETDYMWRNVNFTDNKITVSRTFDGEAEGIESWVSSVNLEIDNFSVVSIDETTQEIDEELTPESPLILNGDDVLIPMIEYM